MEEYLIKAVLSVFIDELGHPFDAKPGIEISEPFAIRFIIFRSPLVEP